MGARDDNQAVRIPVSMTELRWKYHILEFNDE